MKIWTKERGMTRHEEVLESWVNTDDNKYFFIELRENGMWYWWRANSMNDRGPFNNMESAIAHIEMMEE